MSYLAIDKLTPLKGSPSSEKGNLAQLLKTCPDDIVPDLESKKTVFSLSVAGNIVGDQIVNPNTGTHLPVRIAKAPVGSCCANANC